MKSLARPVQISPMRVIDIREVLRIEAACFQTPWPSNAFHNELSDNKLAHYFVARSGEEIVAYAGVWVILEDAHITTVAVHPSQQRQRYGERMLIKLLEEAVDRGASWVTLEVRESNVAAQKLYEKYGFTTMNVRRGYYSDNDENALVMWAGNVKGAIFQNRLAALKERLH
ncbi:MAG: ribosomal protein S18-alanine N-acetyltransferase [Candidatus Eremiobacteraeota bacterium]|nr:ribosomal protein S18-alanine N-acetyltransferase [Candidatus Eremiobacteraeota bacterium]MBC5828080.1 ribosomal protein S18-alanine N-acetyltransferase [Candidatus Eremiobacteraeota bacterium]